MPILSDAFRSPGRQPPYILDTDAIGRRTSRVLVLDLCWAISEMRGLCLMSYLALDSDRPASPPAAELLLASLDTYAVLTYPPTTVPTSPS